MASRYNNRLIGINESKFYKNVLKNRNVNLIRQYFSPQLHHPTVEEVLDLQILSHEWKVGDRYFKLANTYYNDSKLWWIIAWFNQKPTETHLQLGDVVDIPMPLDRILNILDI